MHAPFEPGDPVVHAIHGPGTVQSVQTRDSPDGPREYVAMAVDDMTILVPTEELDDVGIREPIDADDARAVLDLLRQDALADPGHAARRRRNAKRLTGGDAEALAKVIRSLNVLREESGKPLRLADVQHLRQAMAKLVGELAIALDVDEDEAEALVQDAVAVHAADPDGDA